MYVYLFILSIITFIVLFLMIKTITSKFSDFKIYHLIIVLTVVVGWAYYFVPVTVDTLDFKDLDVFVISEDNYKLTIDEKLILEELIDKTKLYRVASDSSFEDLGALQDTVIFVDTPEGMLQVYLQENLENYDRVIYNGILYKIKNSQEYYDFISLLHN